SLDLPTPLTQPNALIPYTTLFRSNHGLSTGALFLIIGMLYERRHTRMMADFGGIAKSVPMLTFFMVFSVLASVGLPGLNGFVGRSEEHTSELQSRENLVCRLLLET